MDDLSYTPVYDEKTRQILEQQFSRIKDECYVDHAGATLYSDDQIKKSLDDLQSSLYMNPHSHGIKGNITEDIIDNIRYTILDHFHTTQDEYTVIFTSGATAALKLVAETFDFKNKTKEIGNFVYLQDNHTSVLGMRDLSYQRGAEVTCVSHDNAFEFLHCSSQNNLEINANHSNSLFVYPAQCNFSGLKYPLSWIENVKGGCLNALVKKETNWFVLLDAACFVGTNDLNLSIYKPDFICISFYKMFGYPTGLGALLVKNSNTHVLEKVYYGGGTVDVVLSSKMRHEKRQNLSQRFEDGTISFLSIIPLRYGFQILSDMSIHKISRHVFLLAKYLHHSLLTLHHQNRAPVVKLYADTDYEDENLQGGIVSFNVLRANGEYVGYMEVMNMAALYNIHLRTGCFCNPGACQRHLDLSDQQIYENYKTGYTCGGTKDLIDGRPTGAVRISFGYMSAVKDVEIVLNMIRKCFVSGKQILEFPIWWSDFKLQLRTRYTVCNKPIHMQPETPSDLKTTQVFIEHLKNKPILSKDNMETRKKNIKLIKILVYPVKSCGEYEVEKSWILTSKGLQYDREWMIVTSAGVSLTQKQEPKLCLLRPIIDLKKNQLILHYPDMPPIKVPLQIPLRIVNNEVCRSKVCGRKIEGIDCGEEVSEWLSLALQKPGLKLIRQIDITNLNLINKPNLSFASQSTLLLINLSSIRWLSDRISDDSECDKDTVLYRFRGNLVVDNAEPFEESDTWMVEIFDNMFKVQGMCNRCQMICIDQKTGKKTVEPLRTLAEKFSGKLKFGIYLDTLDKNCVLNIGDDVWFLKNHKTDSKICRNLS